MKKNQLSIVILKKEGIQVEKRNLFTKKCHQSVERMTESENLICKTIL